jgi:hypothetical protein
VGFGGPGFGWVPLAPFETFHPWWGRGYYGGFHNRTVLVNNINIVNNVNVINTYRNARVRNGVTAVNAHDFANGRFTAPMRMSPDQLRQASLVKGAVPFAPTSSSLRFSDRPVTSPARSAALTNGRFFNSQVNRQGTAGSGNARGVPNAASNSSSWRRFGNSPQAARNAGSGWSRFGNPTAPRANAPAHGTGGWRTAGDRPATAAAPQRYQGGPSDGWRRFQPSTQPPSTPRSNAAPYSGNRSLQIAPPIVRERSTPSYSGGRGYNAPARQSAPSSSSRSSGGGGGHASQSNGGGRSGGGGHSGGGGGGHSGGHGGHR